jgi:hypothetical protein
MTDRTTSSPKLSLSYFELHAMKVGEEGVAAPMKRSVMIVAEVIEKEAWGERQCVVVGPEGVSI